MDRCSCVYYLYSLRILLAKVQLSGGQKARVALARAVYANADVVCLDDVLSAVDAHTARYIWDTCFIDGLLRNKKTVILVSHQIQYLSRPEVDAVILLQKGYLPSVSRMECASNSFLICARSAEVDCGFMGLGANWPTAGMPS